MTTMASPDVPTGAAPSARPSAPAGLARPATTASPRPPHVNDVVQQWVETCVALCQPERVVWCDGSHEERQALIAQGLADRTFIELNQEKLPGCYLHRSNPNDVARTEQLTFICTPSRDLVGPTNNWMNDRQAYGKLRGLFNGCMRGRTMYVV